MKTLSAAVVVLSALLLPGASSALADDRDQVLNRVEFQVQVQREVPNEITRAVMVVERENIDPTVLARDINSVMSTALDTARGVSEVRVSTGNYRTWAVQKDQRILRWRASQELILESADPAALHSLLGRLQQQQMLLRSLDYQVSRARMAQLEDELTAEALKAFRERAELIQASLDATGYDIVQLRIDHSGAPQRPLRMMAMAEAATVVGEPGTGQITASVYSVIQLK